MNREGEIDFGRCLANYMIVLLHAWGAASQYGEVGSWEMRGWTFVASYGCNFALSALFLLSGYLFFKGFSWTSWPAKVGRRVRRLMVPYVCWNLLFVAFYLAVGGLFARVGDRVAAFGLASWSGALAKVLHPWVEPIDVPVWYLRAVFAFALLAPVWWAFLRSRMGRWIGLGLVAGWYVASGVFGVLPGVPGYPADSLVAFYAGGLIAVTGRSPTVAFGRWWWLAPGMAGLGLDLADALGAGSPLGFGARMLLKVPLFFWAVGRLFRPGQVGAVGRWLADSAFFVYAGHFLFCSVWVHALGAKLAFLPFGRMTALMALFVAPGLAVTWSVWWLGRKWCPRVLRLFDGTL